MSLMEKLLAESNFGALKQHSVITATVTEIREDKKAADKFSDVVKALDAARTGENIL